MAKPFRMAWGSKNQDSLGSQIEEVENAKFESEIMNRNEFAEVFGESKKNQNPMLKIMRRKINENY